jgi:regulator of sirC expression with transglutaminase-like and TPR domain
MLNNLKNAYVQAQHIDRAVPVVARLIDLSPDEPAHLRELGLLHYQLDQHGPALHALKRYLSIAAVPPDDPVQQVIAHVQVQIARLN